MSGHKNSTYSSWKNLFLHQENLSAPQLAPSDVDQIAWQSANNMSASILGAFGNVLPKEASAEAGFKQACYKWLCSNPVVKFGEEESVDTFHQFNFNKDAKAGNHLEKNVEVFRTVENQLVCRMQQSLPESFPPETKGVIVNIAAIGYDVWLKKVTNQHRVQHIIAKNGDAKNDSYFLLPVNTGEHILTLTVVTYNFWCEVNGWLGIKPGKQCKPSFIVGSTYN